MPFIPDSETAGRFIPDEGRFVPDEVAPAPFPAHPSLQLAPLTSAAVHPGREGEGGLYTLRVPQEFQPPNVTPSPTGRIVSALTTGLPLHPFSLGAQLEALSTPQKVGPGLTTEAIPALKIPAGIVKGAENVASGAMEFMTSPVGAATAAVSAGPALVRSAVSGIFAVDMASHAPDAYEKYWEARFKDDTTGQAEAITEGLGTLALAGAAGAHSFASAKKAMAELKSPAEIQAPLTEAAMEQVLPERGPAAEPKLSEIFSAKGATDVLYEKIIDAARKNKTTVSGVRDPLLIKAGPLIRSGKINSVSEFKDWVQAGEPTEPLPAAEAAPVAEAVYGETPKVMGEIPFGKTDWLALYETAKNDPKTSPQWKKDALPIMRRLSQGFKDQTSTTDFETEYLRPLFKRVGFETTFRATLEAPPFKPLTAPKPAEPAAAAEVAKTAELTIPELGLTESQLSLNSLRTMAARDPAQWKALKQYFGANTATKVAQLAKAKFERMRTAPKVKWTGATESGEPPLGGALYGPFGIPSPAATVRAVADLVKAATPAVKVAAEAVKETAREAMTAPRMTDYRRSVLNWSGKLQRSFQEAADAQKEIQKAVPDAVRREGITNWIQAGGDPAALTARRDATTDAKLRAGYDAALNLTPTELAVAQDAKTAFDELGKRGQTYDVLNSFRDNYVTQIWDLGKGPAVGTSRTLKDKFRFSKARTFESYFEGEQAGFTPKTKDIAKLLPVYLHEMNSVIAARQLVEQMSKGKASDGRPLVAPRGFGVAVEGPQGKATLIMPKAIKGDRHDYRTLENQPALSDWVWRTEDAAGNPVFEKADLALHPEAYARIRAVLGRSAIREWYGTRTSNVAQIPKAIVKAIDLAQSETKRTMLGFFAPFHQVQEATHAVGHRVNPLFNVPKPDLVNNPAHMDAARHGLMLLPDRVSEGQFMEGFRTSGLVSKIPGIGPMADWYSNYLFKEYIPGLKYKTYEAILGRNQKVYEKELASSEMKPEDVKVLSAEQSNAAYGHLNYADLGRNPTIQHLMQLGLLAPDFLEARARFAGQAIKGATGAKIGREQVIALATLAVAQATTAWIASKLVPNGDWDPEHPFELRVGQRTYTMRSVPEDAMGLVQHTRTFAHSRLSPLVGKGGLQYASGVDWSGRKVSAAQTTRELAAAPIPLTLRSVPGLRALTGMDRPGTVSPLEQLSGAIGLRISRYYPRQELNELYDDWRSKQTDPKIKADYERAQAETHAVSKYKGVRSAMADRDEAALRKAVADLAAEGTTVQDIKKALNPVGKEAPKLLFHTSRDLEDKFKKSLSPEQRKLYDSAVAARRADWVFFRRFF